MNESTTTMTKDPVCGMTVDPAKSLSAKLEDMTYYFCGKNCREKFLADPSAVQPDGKSGGCCR